MAQANKPDYAQFQAPQVDPTNQDLGKVMRWLDREMRALAQTQLDKTALELRPIHVAPPDPREGMIVYADGVLWNPGHGTGVYVYSFGIWYPLGWRPSPPVTVTGTTYTLQVNDDQIIVNSAVNVTLTLPAPASRPGRIIVVKTIQNIVVSSASANVIPLQGTVAGTVIIPSAGKNAWSQLVSDGTNWVIMEEA
jgi:hypothetical protein